MSAATADLVSSRLGRASLVVELPAAGHHVMLDQPLPLVAALRAVLVGWAASEMGGLAVPDVATEG
jgi:pimeloyl-ACP methyl ester carboxylesterase